MLIIKPVTVKDLDVFSLTTNIAVEEFIFSFGTIWCGI